MLHRTLSVLAAFGVISLQSFAGTGNFFLPPVQSDAGSNPSYVVSADFNGDGIPDLAIVNGSDAMTSILVLAGVGDGTFQPYGKVEVSFPPRPWFSLQGLCAADVNNDGLADLVTALGDVYLNLGDGTFQKVAELRGRNWDVVAAGDLDADGNIDVVLSYTFGLWVFWGNGDGTFSSRFEINGFTASGSGLFIGDFNNDGILDVFKLSGNVGLDGLVAYGRADRRLTWTRTMIFGESYDAAIGDFNGDGKLDVSAHLTGTVSRPRGFGVFFGTGEIGPPFPFRFIGDYEPYGSRGVKAGDVDGDGILDLIGKGFVNIGNGDGTFSEPIRFQAGQFDGIETADFNQDGWVDVALINRAAGTVTVYLNAGRSE
ncbi:MAG: VCBS repeat-containing protein [Acidobacteria bacterium]|nr:VCBS repeat-containing protein [Acidobacteriota bacterium]MBI3658596.1 VCBS repeat-containing protein [Acidobacteriota bacterium]